MYTRQSALEKLINSYKAYYNVLPATDIIFSSDDEQGLPLEAICEFYEHSEKYVISRKAELWTADCEEFIYIFSYDYLTLDELRRCEQFALQDGLRRAHVGSGHMYTYITPIFLCDSSETAAVKALKHLRHFRNFRLGIWGWMDYHAALIQLSDDTISTNRSGRYVARALRDVLY